MFGQFNGQENYSGALQNIAIDGGERLTAGAHALVRSEDSIAGTTNRAILKIEFYSQAGAAYGSAGFINEASVVIANASSPVDTWSYSELSAIAPNNAVEARVVLLFQQPVPNLGGAVFVDSVTLSVEACPGDIADDFGTLNADGQVSFGDFLALLGLIGPCTGAPGCTGDIADDFGTIGADGQVSFGDFLALLGLIGPCP